MWGSIGALLTRAGEALGIELSELPDITAIGDAATGAADTVAGQAADVSANVAGASTDLGAEVAAAGETVTGALDEASVAAAPLTDLVPGTPK